MSTLRWLVANGNTSQRHAIQSLSIICHTVTLKLSHFIPTISISIYSPIFFTYIFKLYPFYFYKLSLPSKLSRYTNVLISNKTKSKPHKKQNKIAPVRERAPKKSFENSKFKFKFELETIRPETRNRSGKPTRLPLAPLSHCRS